jgi:uncharacterized protein
MNQPDIARASAYAFSRLERELSPALVYHAVCHTRDEVLPAAEKLAWLEDIIGENLLLLRTAACYHDIGFVVQYADHEAASIQIAQDILPCFGYNARQIAHVSDMIQATRLPQSPHTLCEQVLADADLENLGRESFLQRSLALRAEYIAFGHTLNLTEWYQQQLEFLERQHYFTNAARRLYTVGKQRNMTLLRMLMTIQ